MTTSINPSIKRKEETARFRSQKDDWLLSVLGDRSLSKGSIRVAAFMAIRMNVRRGDFGWGEDSIARELGMDTRSVRRAMSQLRSHHYIEKMRRQGRRGVSIYRLLANSSTGQPCPIEGADLRRVSRNHDTANAIIDRVARNSRPDKVRPSTGQNRSLDRTTEPPKPPTTYTYEPHENLPRNCDKLIKPTAQTDPSRNRENEEPRSSRVSFEATKRIRKEVGI